MKLTDWPWIKGLPKLLAISRPEPVQQAQRIVAVQLNIVLPAKAGLIGVIVYYLFYSGWFYADSTQKVALEFLQRYFLVYIFCNAFACVCFLLWRRLPPGVFQWMVFTLGLLDGLFIAGLTVLTGGFESIAYWLFPALIVLNALSIPLAVPQIVLNLMLSVFYLSAGIFHQNIGEAKATLLYVPGHGPRPQPETRRNVQTNLVTTNALARHRSFHSNEADRSDILWEEPATEPFALHLGVLWMLTVCCYGVQVLAERQRHAINEARAFAMREGQLRSAGRLAAEFAHQIKNPLAIINNAVFSLQRALKENRNDAGKQLGIIQEEVERSDKIITEIMGYAQLSEGRVEKLNLTDELDGAIKQVFPPGSQYGITVEHHYGDYFPPLLMLRRHLSEILVNILQNAREALDSKGRISVNAVCHRDYSIEITVGDDGPGIPPDKLERIFEAYYSSKEKGTGLGLAIAKHNVELYAGSLRAES